jgi:hypothetical protein
MVGWWVLLVHFGLLTEDGLRLGLELVFVLGCAIFGCMGQIPPVGYGPVAG